MNSNDNEISNSNFFSIQKLLCEATKLIRSHFKTIWKQKKKTEWTDDEEAAKFFHVGNGLIISNSVKQYQRQILLSGNSLNWDLSIFGTLFLYKPFKNDQKASLIKTIRDKRNHVFHNPTFSINDLEFKSLWIDISNAMLELGFSRANLNDLQTPEQKKIQEVTIQNKMNLIKEKANAEYRQQNFEKAIELYSSALLLTEMSDQDAAILYSNRSLSYLKLYTSSHKKIDQRNLMRALNDAKMASELSPKWHKVFYRLGQIYKELNDLESSIENYKIALLIEPNDEELKNSLAEVKHMHFEQNRSSHLDEQCLPRTTEENTERMFEKKVERIGLNKAEWDKKVKFLTEKTKELDPILADVWLAHEYRDGSKNVAQNYELAAKYYGKAASAGNAEALYNLALLNENGLGVKKDFKTAFNLLKQAAQKSPTRKLAGNEIPNVGVAEAEHSLGIFYQKGIYIEKNIEIAIEWYNRAIEHGNDSAANNLGALYTSHKPYDLEKAERLFILAHKRGDNNAITNLVDLYIAKNEPDKALLWHERALKNNSLFDICRDEDIREKIEFLKTMENFHLLSQPEKTVEKPNNLLDPNRISLIKSHRKSIAEFKIFSSQFQTIKNTYIPPKRQQSSNSIANLKWIEFNEIDFTKDHVLEGFKISITIIDVPMESTHSIFFLVEDKNYFVERMAVYNLKGDIKQIIDLYPIGARFVLMNPYIRMAKDGMPMLRVDDPKSLVLMENVKFKMCRFCGSENSKYNCARCLNSFYCSQQCQINDWKILDHKLICYPKNN